MKETILERVGTPDDLKHIDPADLPQLAAEVRKLIMETTSANGGHLASSLGTVELAIALLRVLDPPRDRIIWDVGHQAYPYKILTGRREQFRTLRQYGGISGFPRRSESEYDVVDSGHSGSSISYGLGLAVARDLLGQHFAVASVIGDGSMTSGVAFEAMNQAGHHLDANLIIVLNDNEMSISENVGGISAYLSRIRIKRGYTLLKQELEDVLRLLPPVGEGMLRIATQLKDSISHALLPGMLFESLGVKYVGPIDGHDIAVLEETLSEARLIERPVLLHVVTTKGKGYAPAEKSPELFHGVAPFDRATGKPVSNSTKPSYTRVFGEAMVQLAEEDEKLVAITAAMGSGTGLGEFSEMFPERFFDMGIAEQLAVNMAAALALGGLKPVVAIYSTFLQRAFDQLSQEVCLQGLPVVFAVDRAGVVGDDGATHHGYFDLSYLSALPGMLVMAPATAREVLPMLQFALASGGPAAVRFPRDTALSVEGVGASPLRMGRGELLSPGEDVALLAIGDMVGVALDAARSLGESGVSASVVNTRFAKPLDELFLYEVADGKRLIVTMEDNVEWGGLGSRVATEAERLGLAPPVLTLALPDRYVQHGTRAQLLGEVGLDAASVASRTRERLERL